jgi:hypothetical protein
MAVQAKAKGDAKATGMPRNIPPDEISHVRAPSGAGYGEAGGENNPSSIPPGKTVVSRLGANIGSLPGGTVDDDGVLEKILSRPRGALDEGEGDWQTRKIDPTPQVPAAHGMKSRQVGDGSPGGAIPSKIGASSAPLPKRPA